MQAVTFSSKVEEKLYNDEYNKCIYLPRFLAAVVFFLLALLEELAPLASGDGDNESESGGWGLWVVVG